MSQESSHWLNTKTLIGFVLKRGRAWHYREEHQDEPNHYDDAIPVADVIRRLFNFSVIEEPLMYTFRGIERETDRKLMLASDNGDLLGVFKNGYQGHDYKEWLLDNVGTILSDELHIGSAGLLKNRAQAWVSVEVPETITTPEGVAFRPNLTAATSFDGSLASTYKRMVQIVVCDNTLAAGLGETGQQYKVKHSRNSTLKVKDARDALAIVYGMADDFAAEVTRLTQWNVTEKQFQQLLDLQVPIPTDSKTTRGVTLANKKRDEITNLYRADVRAATWNGTAFGVLQAYNTWAHHVQNIKGGVPRVVRNMENVVTGKYANDDALLLQQLAAVTAA